MMTDPTNSPTEAYALWLLTGECGEAQDVIGRAGRFGLDSPDGDKATPRLRLAEELGDVMAAIEYGIARKVIDRYTVVRACQLKLAKLLDPDSRDNLGRRLAP